MISKEKLAGFGGDKSKPAQPKSAPGFDMDGYLALRGFEVTRTKPWQSRPGGVIYELAKCPFSPDHTGGSAAFTMADGQPGFGCKHAGCQGKTVKDVFAIHPPPRTGPSTVADDWPEPQPLQSESPAVLPFSPELLPEAFRSMVMDIAERMQIPVAFPAVLMVLCLAGVVNRRARIQPKERDTSWVIVPNLWGGIVAEPGRAKSPVIAAATRPLNRIQTEWRREYKEALKQHTQEMEEYGLRLDVWKNRYKEAVRKGQAPPARPDDEPAPPNPRRLIVNDGTFEAIHKTMNENPAGLLIIRDELTGWWSTLDRDGREGERAFHLQAWNGDTPHIIDRIGRGVIDVPACCESMLGGIQPARLRSYLVDAIDDGPENDGLVQRFQLLVWPDLSPDWDYVDRPPDAACELRASRVYRALLELDAENPALFKFAPEAQLLFIEWLRDLEYKLRGNELHSALVSHLSKFRSLMPTLALLFELADRSGSEGFEGSLSTSSPNFISLEHTRQAAAWCELLESHARRVYSCVATPQLRAARELAEKIKERKIAKDGFFSCREVYLKGWSGLETPEAVRSAAEVLEDSGWIRDVSAKSGPAGGRPSNRYEVNPKVWK